MTDLKSFFDNSFGFPGNNKCNDKIHCKCCLNSNSCTGCNHNLNKHIGDDKLEESEYYKYVKTNHSDMLSLLLSRKEPYIKNIYKIYNNDIEKYIENINKQIHEMYGYYLENNIQGNISRIKSITYNIQDNIFDIESTEKIIETQKLEFN